MVVVMNECLSSRVVMIHSPISPEREGRGVRRSLFLLFGEQFSFGMPLL